MKEDNIISGYLYDEERYVFCCAYISLWWMKLHIVYLPQTFLTVTIIDKTHQIQTDKVSMNPEDYIWIQNISAAFHASFCKIEIKLNNRDDSIKIFFYRMSKKKGGYFENSTESFLITQGGWNLQNPFL